LARTFEAEGDYLLQDANQPEGAIKAYQRAIDLQKQIEVNGAAHQNLAVRSVQTEASLSHAFVAAKKYPDALTAAQNCREAMGKAELDDEAVKAANAGCDLAEAEAQRNLGHLDQAIGKAKAAAAKFSELAGKGPANVGYAIYVMKNAQAMYELFLALLLNDQR